MFLRPLSSNAYKEFRLDNLQNTPEVEPYIDQHMTFLKEQHPAQRQAWLEKEHSKMFGKWLRNQVERELAVAKESIKETLRDAYADVDEEFSTTILPQNDNILPRVDPLDLGKESRDDYFRTDCRDSWRNSVVKDAMWLFSQILKILVRNLKTDGGWLMRSLGFCSWNNGDCNKFEKFVYVLLIAFWCIMPPQWILRFFDMLLESLPFSGMLLVDVVV
ncbi:hypothetical protein L6452_20306 [Arctium lappa]|uniref:Uncharacterized protein n=1 Tax=Arctium lappa TaxID=4217 RepID=A0ACB9BBW0_ARCLA|nr:hypothetical protein L6452_20306 [Arctium lappa]